MNRLFKVDETVTVEDWEEYSTSFLSHKTGGVGRLLNAASYAEGPVNAFLGILLIAVGAIMLLGLLMFLGDKNMYPVFPLLIFMCVGALFFGIRTFRQRKVSRSRFSDMLSRSGIKDTPMEFSFEEDAFFVRESGRSSSFRYHALSAVWEDKGRYYLFIAGKMQFILQKAAFTSGDPEEFRAFIGEKTGQPVITVK